MIREQKKTLSETTIQVLCDDQRVLAEKCMESKLHGFVALFVALLAAFILSLRAMFDIAASPVNMHFIEHFYLVSCNMFEIVYQRAISFHLPHSKQELLADL